METPKIVYAQSNGRYWIEAHVKGNQHAAKYK